MPQFKSYSIWSPEWYANWNEQDSETIKEWLTTLRTVSCQLNIPNFPYREEAARTIRKKNQLIFRSQALSKNKRATIAALIHFILKEYDKMRPLKDISRELSLDSKSVMKQAWILKKTLKQENEAFSNKIKNASGYLQEFAGQLTKNTNIIIDAEKILIELKRVGGNPIGLAAGAFYYVCKKNKEPISKEKIGATFRISERTVYSNEVRIRKILSKDPKVAFIPQILVTA
jgi:transcription initiation factor TFIIIB Brf1 subunit/transcription initiation factor TFIIB